MKTVKNCKFSKYLVLLTVLTIGTVIFASESNTETVFSSKENIVIPTGEKPEYKGITVPAVPVSNGKVIALTFTGWFNVGDGGGWVQLTALKINGKNITTNTPQGKVRLLNRQGKLKTTIGDFSWWNNDNPNVYFLTMFLGLKNQLDARVSFPREEKHRYVLDITDLLNTKEDNTVEFGNYLTLGIDNDQSQRPLMIEDIQLIAIGASEVAAMRGEGK